MKKCFLVMFFCTLMVFLFTSCGERAGFETKTYETDNLFKKNHTVTLVVGDSIKQKITTDDGETLKVGYTPKKENHLFMGWYTDRACTMPYDFSRPVVTSFYLYAGFALQTKTINCKGVKIKALSEKYDYSQSLGLSLAEFNYDYLEKNGMGLQFKIVYNVNYTKDYNILWDIGYAGSPKYELTLKNSSSQGYYEENLTTTKSIKEKCYTYNTELQFSKNEYVYLVFSTDNVQNVISFSDIVVTVEVIKVRN